VKQAQEIEPPAVPDPPKSGNALSNEVINNIAQNIIKKESNSPKDTVDRSRGQ